MASTDLYWLLMRTMASTERTRCLALSCILTASGGGVRWWAARDARRGCVRARRVQAKGMVQGEGWGGEAKVEWGSVQDEKGGGGVLGSAGRACILRSCAFACVVGQWPDWRRGLHPHAVDFTLLVLKRTLQHHIV